MTVSSSTKEAIGPSKLTVSRFALTMMLGTLAIAMIAMSMIPMAKPPHVVVELRSDGVIFQPARNYDLISLVRPRYSMLTDTLPFEGWAIHRDPLRSDIVIPAAGDEPELNISNVVNIQSVVVTAGCHVRIEPVFGLRFRVEVSQAGVDTARIDDRCSIYVEALTHNGASDSELERVAVQRRIPRRAAVMNIELLKAMPFRRFSVSGLAFTTNETDSLATAIRSGVLRWPDHGNRSDTLYHRDSLSLGVLDGDLVTLVLDTTLHAVYRGTAAAPALGHRNLKPSMLRDWVHWNTFQLVVAGLVTLAGCLLPFLPNAKPS